MHAVRHLVGSAAVGSAMLLLAACGVIPSDDTGGTTDGTPGASASAGPAEQHVLLSDGTATVTIDGTAVTFPTTVTDAAWSPDGSRVAFIDGDGNVASARPDSSDLLVYTSVDATVTRSRPAWSGVYLLFTEKHSDGTSTLMRAFANGGASGDDPRSAQVDHETGDGTSYIDLNQSSIFVDLGITPVSVFQHEEPTGPQVWILDHNQRAQVEYKIDDGSEPAMSPDGSKLAYVGGNGQIFVQQLASGIIADGPAVQVSFGADAPRRLSFTPDGSQLAFETARDAEEIAATVPADATANPAQQLAAKPAVPSVAAVERDSVVRITGADPVAESIVAAQARFPAADSLSGYGVGAVQVVALDSVASATVYSSYPLLLTDGNTLDPRVLDEIHRLVGSSVGVQGGEPASRLATTGLSAAVEQQLIGLGFGPAVTTGWNVSSEGASDEPYGVVVVGTDASPAEKQIARALGIGSVVPVVEMDTSQPPTGSVARWLARSSTTINRIYVVGAMPDSFVAQLAAIVSGPPDFDTVARRSDGPAAPVR